MLASLWWASTTPIGPEPKSTAAMLCPAAFTSRSVRPWWPGPGSRCPPAAASRPGVAEPDAGRVRRRDRAGGLLGTAGADREDERAGSGEQRSGQAGHAALRHNTVWGIPGKTSRYREARAQPSAQHSASRASTRDAEIRHGPDIRDARGWVGSWVTAETWPGSCTAPAPCGVRAPGRASTWARSSNAVSTLDWSDLDRRAVDTVRTLAMDAVEKAGNGHPGTAMSLAPAAYLLFQRVMRHDPTDPHWPGRDRFVLSCGHSSLTLYIQLYLSGYGLELDDLQAAAAVGLAHPGPPRARAHRRAWRPRPARSARGWATRSAWRWRPAGSGACSTRTPTGTARSTTTSTRSAPTATSRRASATRSARSPATRSWATSSSSGTTTRSPSRTTPPSPSPRTSRPATRRTAGTSSTSTGGSDDGLPRGRRGALRRDRWRPRRRPAGRRSSRCAPSSAGRRRTSRTPARSTARRWARTRWPRPSSSSASTRTQSFAVDDEVLAHAREVVGARPGRARRSGSSGFDAWAAANPEPARAVRPAVDPDPARGLDRRAARVPGRPEGHGHPQGLRRGARRARPGAARAVGRLGRPGREQQHHDRGRAVVRPAGVRHQGRSRATGTAGRSTSESASTAWARSSTASCCTAAPGPTAARSWSSATTCARRYGWPR